jgi:hypothetical protein
LDVAFAIFIHFSLIIDAVHSVNTPKETMVFFANAILCDDAGAAGASLQKLLMAE